MNEQALSSLTLRSVRKFISYSGKVKYSAVHVTYDDWNRHKTLQRLLLCCYRSRKINIHVLNCPIEPKDSIKGSLDFGNKQVYGDDSGDETKHDVRNVFMQYNCVPPLFLNLDNMTPQNIDYTLLRSLETYSNDEIVDQLSRYCTRENFNQLVNVCMSLQKPAQKGSVDSWLRYVDLKNNLIKLNLIQRVQARPDSDYRFVQFIKTCGRNNTSGSCAN